MADPRRDRVLIVEDDPGVIRLQQLRLERAGYQVEVASTATEALAIARRGDIDLVLLDQMLPGGVTGLELYQQIKEAGQDIPTILVTGFGNDSIVLQAFRAGVYDFVPKTADYLDYLLPCIARVLQKRRTECQLMESEARLSSIIRSGMDGVLTVDEEQKIDLFNPAAEQMFGLSCQEAQGQPIQRFLPDWPFGREDRQNSPQAEGIDSFPPPLRWESEGVRANGARFPVEVSAVWVEANRRRFWTCVTRDITERKHAEQERERLIREQAARREAEAARQRMETIARENDRLYQELRQVDRLKDQFLAMLAHELRNPLAPIRNTLHLIRLQLPVQDSEQLENWAVIERQVNHLVRLVDDLLDVSRINQGKIQLQSELLDLAGVIARTVESSQPLISVRGHALAVSLPQSPLLVHGDPVRLVQVLSNLLNNAAKYTPEGGRISLIASRVPAQAIGLPPPVGGSDQGNEWVEIRVRDTGVGIAPEVLPRLFDPFIQSERTLDRAEGGLGVGLTLVRRLTEMHGGSVQAHSAGTGQGSEFIVYLPLKEGPLPASPPPFAPSPLPPRTRQARRLLVVDDNPDSVRTLTRLLEVLGHKVITARDGRAALQQAERERPEGILLDIGLPEMDGYEVTRQLRKRPEFQNTLIVALTGYGSPEDRERAQQAGFNAHLVKPVDLEALRQLLETVPQSPQG